MCSLVSDESSFIRLYQEMGRKLRFIPKEELVEVTVRTVQSRFLLLPVPHWRETFVGVLGRAQELYPVRIHGYVCLSNHFHLLVTPADAHQLASFMGHVLTNLSKEAGRLHGWRGPLFERRYQAIMVSTEEAAQVERLRYLLAHGCKEGLVEHVGEWPGPHCAESLKSGSPAKGVWVSRTQIWDARNHGREPEPREFCHRYEIHLEPLPCWGDMAREEVRRRIVELIRSIEEEVALVAPQRGGSRALGVEKIIAQDAYAGPRILDRRPAPFVHAASRRKRREFRERYGEFLRAFCAAAEKLRNGLAEFSFPEGSFSPSGAPSRPG